MRIGVAHAAWAPGRKEALARLANQIGYVSVQDSPTKEHASTWAPRLWRWAAEHGDDVLLLNDDVIPHPSLIACAEELVALLPGEVISLHGNFPAFRDVAGAGFGLARCYWPSGPAYILQRGHAAELLAWLETVPKGWFGGTTNEDGAIASWLWSRQTPAYVSIPALVRHDVTIPSTLPGFDQHPNRTAPIDWDDFPIDRPWTQRDVDAAPYVPVPWLPDSGLALLGKQLRGAVPGCAFCGALAPPAVRVQSGAGLCLACARAVGRVMVER